MKAGFFLLAITPLVAGWNLQLSTTDGRKVTMHGTADSGCKNIEFTPTLNVNRANFNPKTSWHSDPQTFELYVGRNCDGLSYRGSKGNKKIKARKIKSYKVW